MPPALKFRRSARIAIGSETFSAPTDSPYDRQLLFEFAGHLARRRPPIRVRIDRTELTVSAVGDKPCCTCAGGPAKLALMQGPQALCAHCASRLFHREEYVAPAKLPRLRTRKRTTF